VVVLAVVLVGARLFGLQVYSVMSGSMVPKFPVGSLIYVREVDYKTLKPGDVITYRLNSTTISTHRIVEVHTDGGYSFSTKGDANDDEDGPPVLAADIIGKPIVVIPLVGYIAYFIQRPPWMYIAIAAGALLVMLIFLPDLLGKEKKEALPSEAGESPETCI